jgi:hypothetical protein
VAKALILAVSHEKPTHATPNMKTEEIPSLELFQKLAGFHAGLDLQYRRSKDSWPCQWRASLRCSSKFHKTHAARAYGDTAEAALLRLMVLAQQADIQTGRITVKP